MRYIRMHENDDVGICLQQLVGGMKLNDVIVRGLIPAGHKVALRSIEVGGPIRRCNQIIGFASKAIAAGEHVHTHNCFIGEGLDDSLCETLTYSDVQAVPSAQRANFMGYRRQNGRVGTRNYIGILTSVNCSATVARNIADYFSRRTNPDALRQFQNIDGVVALTHSGGCAIDSCGLGIDILRRTLTGYANHPNFSAVLVVGLGCETNQIDSWFESSCLSEHNLLKAFNIQDAGGTSGSIEKGISLVKQMLNSANAAFRESCDIGELKVGLQCGGSDSYSGISANPALGVAVDLLVAHGATAILSETPEIYGAEHLLTRRAISQRVAEKLLSRVRWWEQYVASHNGEMNNNPSPGNKAGGLTTILEKSLGAIAKSGSSRLCEVYEYAEKVCERGLVFMDTPGYDPVSATGQVAGGANLLCFTTGRGSAYGSIPVPSIKLATNSLLWQRQRDDLDLNCGEIIDGLTSVQNIGHRIFDLILQTASGAKTRSELHGYGQCEFVPWQLGAVM